MAKRSPILGYNHNVRYRGLIFHVQTEDSGLMNPHLFTHLSRRTGRKLVIGYILRHHPSWIRLIAEARALGGPYVFRMNLNQQSAGAHWETHKQLMKTTSPLVDCGVHYLDVMCQITDAKPKQVRGMGLRLTNEIAPDMYNYGHLQVIFDDGSVGWYEAGWGPMMSETAFFVKDIISPNGCVSIVMNEGAKSADHDTHTKTNTIRVHHAETSPDGAFLKADAIITGVVREYGEVRSGTTSSNVISMSDDYLADSMQNWSNTLKVGKAQINNPGRWGATD